MRRRRQDAGLCPRCGKPRSPGHGDHGRNGAHVDDVTLRHAQQAIIKGQAGIAAWRGAPRTAARAQRDDVRASALAQVALAVRFLGELLERHGFAL